MLVSWLEGATSGDIHPDAQKLLEVLEQADVIKKRSARLEVDEQIQVAVRTSLALGDGAENGDPVRATFLRDVEDLRAALRAG